MGKKGIWIRGVEHLKRVLKESRTRFKVQAAFLFGSWAESEQEFLEESDWDLMIISDEFEGFPFPDRATLFLREVPIRRADVFCYTNCEVAERKEEIGLVRAALKGIKLS